MLGHVDPLRVIYMDSDLIITVLLKVSSPCSEDRLASEFIR